jgi:predicted porin
MRLIKGVPMKKFTFLFPAFIILTVLLSQKLMAAPPMALSDAEVAPHKQWEVWFSLNYRDMEKQKSYNVPTVEVIYGILPRVELSVEATYIIEKSGGDRVDGIDSVATQAKVLMVEEGKRYPQIALAMQYEVPTDEKKERLEWSGNLWVPSISMQKHFGKALLITQLKYYIDDKWRYGIDVFYAFNERLTLLSEVYAEDFVRSSDTNELNFRLGFKYQFSEKAKFFFAAGRSLLTTKDNRPELEANGGIMFEF